MISPRRLFVLTFALVVFDFIDRLIVVSMFPQLRSEWQLSDAQLGALSTVVALAVGIGAIPLARLADRGSRTKALGTMGVGWSLATLLGSYASGFLPLFAARFMVGAAQSGYVPVAGSLLCEAFPPRRHATVLGAFQSGVIFGSVLGILLGGILAERYGWRVAMAIAAITSGIAALPFFFVRLGETNRQAPVVEMIATPVSRAVMLAYAGFAVMTLVAATMATWLPSFFYREYQVPIDRAGMMAALVLVAAGIGSIVLAWATDRIAATFQRHRLLSAATFAMFATGLLVLAFSMRPGMGQFVTILAAGFFLVGHMGSVFATIAQAAGPGRRVTSLAILVAVQNLVGIAGGPLLAGALSDRFGLPTALQIVGLLGVPAVAAFYASASLQRTTARN